MKKIKLLLLLLYFSIIGFSQTNTFIIKAIDSKGLVDSVIMGYRDNATVGIDADLGESDYFDKPYSDLDIRSIQRDSVTHDSIWLFSNNGSHIVNPFPKNIDLKKDFRSTNSYGAHFIVKVKAKNYPVVVKLAYLNYEEHISFCGYVDNNEDESINGELKNLLYGKGKDTIAVFKDSTENRVIGFHPFLIESIVSQTDINSKLTIFPNPVLETLSIISTNYGKQTLIIFNSSGVIVEKLELNNKRNINVSNLPKGLYFIQVGTHVNKFIKQ